ncbi:energy-coupling factor transporter ATPase [Virgibacillus sp. C22-A2]|uniref:Energy-coupling factor transporter ATPase n=1 Tax=Virgibacillus tibetensis TaxID=3042313 RepID=A0ABU6KD51_9BACI|nr:energy-coupling factor transporter ATPase [Virgibacillus sp. C22-A2]
MEILSAENVSFTFPESEVNVIDDVHFSIEKGEFIVLCGASGSGKSTLLRLIKQDIAPHGNKQGRFFFKGDAMEVYSPFVRAKEIGMVFQDPENQIVMDTVMEELLFGLENMGYSTAEMRKKIAEMVHYFGLNHLLVKKTSELSGGEKQLVNLASILLLDPTILLLDEPTAQLDPIAAKEFIHTLERLNDEFGITIVIVEHRLEELFAIADRVILLENGKIATFDQPRNVVGKLANHQTMSSFLPSASRVYLDHDQDYLPENIPLTVKEAKQWLEEQVVTANDNVENENPTTAESILEVKEIDFQYAKHTTPVLNNLSLSVLQGEWLAVLGANGTGKSTLLKIISGILKSQHGSIMYKGKKMKKINSTFISYLPQNPILFFLQDTILEEYRYLVKLHRLQNGEASIKHLLKKFQLTHLKDRHPHDLSGGELQKAALIGALLIKPTILLLDEPTKGMDPAFKINFGKLVSELTKEGLTIIMVTHDVEFAASYATRCSMIFQGEITITENTRAFFHENTYYTTVMNRITRQGNAPSVVTLEEARQRWRIQKDS